MTAVAYGLSLGLGAVATALALVVTPRLFTDADYWKKNYRGKTVFAPGGMVLAKPLIIGGVLSSVLELRVWGPHDHGPLITGRDGLTVLGAGLAMGFLGFLDDLYGDRHAGGLFGHARALLRGQLTTGMVKAVGGVAVGLVTAHVFRWRGWWMVMAGAVVALTANLVNLLDLRPGRAIKLWTLGAIGILNIGIPYGGALPLATVLAGVVVFAVAELREDVMLGDTGANLLGAVLGASAIAALDRKGLVVLLVFLSVVTLLSEVISFSRIIEASSILTWLDELGRKRVAAGK